MSKQHKFDLVVIGAGPGGYVAAIRAAQLGMQVACVDENDQLGGTCLRVGCIPSKALLESSELYAEANHAFSDHGIKTKAELDLSAMLHRKDRVVTTLTKGVASLLKKNSIQHVQGRGRLNGSGRVAVKGEESETELEAESILIATGSKPAQLAGVELDGDWIGTSTEALAYESVPEHLVVIGAGYIGLEMGTVWRRLGAKVTVLEYLDRILPGTDSEVAAAAQKIFEKQGLEFHLGSRVTAAQASKKGKCRVECENADPIKCDRVLIAAGRVPQTEGLELETAGVETDEKGFIVVDDDYRTTTDGVYAIGDVIGGPLLAHKAEEEGIACVEKIATGYGEVNYQAIPSVVYTHPEIAAVGSTEDELQDSGREYRKGVFPFLANGRARALGQTDGFVKMLADAETDRILGVHILGPRAGDLIAEAVTAVEFGASSEDLALTSHAHPTLAEVMKEAALAVHNRALHN
ncbi:MAG: dihydrolipoyl dehydrogenase [Planctomycetota bacterium]|nr:MAG: dihydrolipoyl dehydrogenase [Planctomycetota bacterium]REK20010.1 MAG: dihydrolipoyl dehydrogenase [Planctomycetota bacterium]REK27577.1 MAG: dihydrolipoyl dehydrogenase [Planctomycetota bacterium]